MVPTTFLVPSVPAATPPRPRRPAAPRAADATMATAPTPTVPPPPLPPLATTTRAAPPSPGSPPPVPNRPPPPARRGPRGRDHPPRASPTRRPEPAPRPSPSPSRRRRRAARSTATAPSGNITFTVTNKGDEVTEFYLLAEDGLRIISEIENIGPGLSRDLVVQLRPGTYVTACKPGMIGDGIRAAFTVTDSGQPVGPTGTVAEQLAEAQRRTSLTSRTGGTLISGTEAFAEAYASGDDDTAREFYARTRPLGADRARRGVVRRPRPPLDAREADLAEGDWSGWHRIREGPLAAGPRGERRRGLRPLTSARHRAAADWSTSTQQLVDKVNDPVFPFEAFQIGNGAKELLDEVATGKVTGEEEIWSHTDLWDFQANVDGAWVAFGVLREVAEAEDPALVAALQRTSTTSTRCSPSTARSTRALSAMTSSPQGSLVARRWTRSASRCRDSRRRSRARYEQIVEESVSPPGKPPEGSEAPAEEYRSRRARRGSSARPAASPRPGLAGAVSAFGRARHRGAAGPAATRTTLPGPASVGNRQPPQTGCTRPPST